VIDKIVSANAESKSLGKARKLLLKLAELDVSASLIEDYTTEIGSELQAHLQQQAESHAAGKLQPQHAEPPGVAAISVDGGRIMTRAAGVRGVHEQAWKETKNACLQTMSSATCAADPHPQLPTCFQQPAYVEKLVREMHAAKTSESAKQARNPGDNAGCESADATADEASSALQSVAPSAADWRPRRLVQS
jgi:hypothetical protein